MNSPWAKRVFDRDCTVCDAQSRLNMVRTANDPAWLQSVIDCHDTQKVVVTAAQRRLKLVQRGPDMAVKNGCVYQAHLPPPYEPPKFPKPIGQCCVPKLCSINCGRKAK